MMTQADRQARSLRLLWAYTAADDFARAWHDRLLARRRDQGYDVRHFCLSPKYLNGGHWLPFPELDRRWREADADLMRMYSELLEKLDSCDVLIHHNGANLHPEFVSWLRCIKVYTAGDDPESTDVLSKPVAPGYDIHLVNNVACVPMYRGWGLKRAEFWPLGSLTMPEDVADLTEEKIADPGWRDIPIVFVGGRTAWRSDRIDSLVAAFPQAWVAGSGWPKGLIPWATLWDWYRRAQVGWNFHNSTGPIAFRTYELAAFGVMQLCDNKPHLGEVFELGKEVVGFTSPEECIELTRHYLASPREQRAIAIGGWKRWQRDYTPDRVWGRLLDAIDRHLVELRWKPVESQDSREHLARHAQTHAPRLWPRLRRLLGSALHRLR